ncbi:hypothetical protein [uncultured Dysosmobacter sp.]|uniref:hypothetical protein n=1 Tax=uncultured Dysosmobacter sp. TaxID=2591384 RepID=UPI00261095F5|nr:hypothetical protein [uncultured Dysosmobacter sp.]
MKILSCGAGMQSTALALMSCENSFAKEKKLPIPYPAVPIYDLVVFCDLGLEPPWVKRQVEFIRKACESAGIPFKVLDSPLYKDFMKNFGERRTISIPWWTLGEDGHKSRMPRNCTIDYKVEMISKFFRWEVLGYKKGQRLRDEDKKAHEMHMGFSAEEARRCKESPNPMFINKFPLVEMGLVRADNYAYIKDVWGLETRASACTFCPFHKNYFFQYLKKNLPEEYRRLVEVDELLRDKNPKPPMDSDLFISRSRKRIKELTPEDCCDAECFEYHGRQVWNGF